MLADRVLRLAALQGSKSLNVILRMNYKGERGVQVVIVCLCVPGWAGDDQSRV